MSPEEWTELQCQLRTRLKSHGYCGHPLLDCFDSKRHHLVEMIRRTALMGESNSVLIIGGRGSGKSALVECVLEEAFADSSVADNTLHVALDGLIHSDDNIALEDITRQLQMTGIEQQRPLGSFSEKLNLVLAALKQGPSKSKAILFTLDNFDLFCGHKNQTLLYNLFDVAQSRQSPVCIIGMSCRPDVVQVLENRVNSRFSHQKILLYDPITFEEYQEAAKEILTLPSKRKPFKKWNTELEKVLEEPEVKEALKSRFEHSHTMRDLKHLLALAILDMESSSTLLPEHFKAALQQCTEDSKSCILQGLSVLEVSLIIAMMHLTEIYDGEPFNFEIVCNELFKFFKKRMMWNLEKSVIMKAFEHLLDLELVKPCSETSGSVQKRYVLVRLMLDVNQVKEAVDQYQNLPVQLKQWAISAIDG